ncbi:hypothetical protein [Paenibacillus sp. 1P07SE]|uniref:hypothetical protein n=1 Tax=Paenibacillus sp. 1P07SE TaxID=3132209 RepID=UPI0039A4F824
MAKVIDVFTDLKLLWHVPVIKVIDPSKQQKKLSERQQYKNYKTGLLNLNWMQDQLAKREKQIQKELKKAQKAALKSEKVEQVQKAAINSVDSGPSAEEMPKRPKSSNKTKSGRRQQKKYNREMAKRKKEKQAADKEESAAQTPVKQRELKKNDFFDDKAIKSMKMVFPLEAAKKQLSSLYKFSKGALEATNARISAEALLQSNLNNQASGMTPEIGRQMSAHVDQLQNSSTISSVAGIGGMTELSESVMNPQNIMKMTGSMYDLAASTHGAKVSQEQVVKTAEAMGDAMKGKVSSLEELGVKFTKQQEQIMQYGNEAQRTQTLVGLLEKQVGGAAAAMADTPEGRILQLQNAWTGIQETIGQALLPAVMSLVEFIMANMPAIENIMTQAFMAVGAAVQFIVSALQIVFNFIVDNWATILPILVAIATVFLVAIIIQLYAMAVAWLAAAWPILLIILIVALLVEAIMMMGGTTEEIVGAIVGSFALLFAHLWNGVAVVWNLFASFAEFLMNLFIDPVYAIQKLFYDLSMTIYELILSIVKAIEDMVLRVANILNKLGLNIDVSGGFDFVSGKIEDIMDTLEKNKPESDKKIIEMARMSLKDPTAMAEAGFNYGSNLVNQTRGKLDGFKNKVGTAAGSDVGKSIPANMPITASPGGREPNIGQVGRVGEVGKIDKEVDISQEDLKLMRDLAEIKAIQNFVTLTPTVQVTTGDIVEKADLDEMIRRFQQSMEQEIAYAAKGVYG